MNNTSILDTVLSNIDKKRAKNMERRMMLAVKIAEGIKRKGLSQKELLAQCTDKLMVEKIMSTKENHTYSVINVQAIK